MALKATTDCMSDLLKLQLPETQRRLIPVSMNDLIRVGRDHDGGYVLPRRLIEVRSVEHGIDQLFEIIDPFSRRLIFVEILISELEPQPRPVWRR